MIFDGILQFLQNGFMSALEAMPRLAEWNIADFLGFFTAFANYIANSGIGVIVDLSVAGLIFTMVIGFWAVVQGWRLFKAGKRFFWAN